MKYLIRFLCRLALLCCLAPAPSGSFAQDRSGSASRIEIQSDPLASLAGLDTAFARALKEEHAPGFSVAVVWKDRIIYSRGFGYRDYEHRLPVTPNTLFCIASCTKAFTGALVGMTEGNAKIALDSPIRSYFPELRFYNDNMNDRITVRDMLCHRTGLPRHDASWYYFTTPSRAELLSRIRYQQPTADVHEKWQYNNLMFAALGALCEKLSGQTWEDLIQKKIFTPLGMLRSTTDFSKWIQDSDASLGYSIKEDSSIHREPYRDAASLGPAGGINSCSNDMAKWLLLWIHGGKYGDQQIIPAGFASEAITPQMVMPGGLPSKERPDLYISNYGLGWMIGSYRGHYRVIHDGQFQGFSSMISFFPSDSLGIVVLCNEQDSYIPSVVRNLIADKMLGLDRVDWQTDLQKIIDKRAGLIKLGRKMARAKVIPGTHPSHPLKDYTGTFENLGYGTIRVETRHDSLFSVLPSATFWLRHFHYDIFETIDFHPGEAIDSSDFGLPHFQFNTDDNGHIASISAQFESNLPPSIFTRRS